MSSPFVVRYTKMFQDADVNNDGALSYPEVMTMMRENGYPGTDEEIKGIFNMMDTSGDNLISLDEFLNAMGRQDNDIHSSAFMRAVFRAYDRDGNGQIDHGELKSAFQKMGQYFSDDDVGKILAVADTDQSGTISYEEFIEKAAQVLR